MECRAHRLTPRADLDHGQVMTSHAARAARTDRVDLAIVGAGIVGLGHAVAAQQRGLSIAVIERNERAIGASIRNFGHGCFTAQAGLALRYAETARTRWQQLAKDAGFWLQDAGTVVVARADDEYAVLEDFRARRGEDVVLLDAAAVGERVPTGSDVVGGAWLPRDLRVDPREAIPAITSWLEAGGVRFHWSSAMQEVTPDGVRTSQGLIEADRVVVAVGHDVDRYYPEVAREAELVRCVLHMLRVTNVSGTGGSAAGRIDPAVLSGYSLLRYAGFAPGTDDHGSREGTGNTALEQVRERLAREVPLARQLDLNLMFTQRPDGDLTIGDTHSYARTPEPFQSETADDLILEQTAKLLGVGGLTVRERWRGVYASAREPFLVAAPHPSTRVVSVTSGIGLTTGFGLAEEVIAELF
jgi:FAD dependent oxidoreductase TIGR03364